MSTDKDLVREYVHSLSCALSKQGGYVFVWRPTSSSPIMFKYVLEYFEPPNSVEDIISELDDSKVSFAFTSFNPDLVNSKYLNDCIDILCAGMEARGITDGSLEVDVPFRKGSTYRYLEIGALLSEHFKANRYVEEEIGNNVDNVAGESFLCVKSDKGKFSFVLLGPLGDDYVYECVYAA